MRIAVIGLDCATPQLVFDQFKSDLPNLSRLWRSVGSVGYGSIHTFNNNTGLDDANHAQHGIFIHRVPGQNGGRHLSGLRIYDVAPTILDLFGISFPEEMQGKTIHST